MSSEEDVESHRRNAESPRREPEKVTKVEALRLEPGVVQDWLDLPGTLGPLREVDVGPEVGGLLEWRGPKEGDRVATGERLALVDRERLELSARQAELGLDRARLAVEAAAEGGLQAEAAEAQAGEQEKKARAVRDQALADRERARALLAEQLAPRSYAEGFETAAAAAEADLAAAASGIAAARSARESAVFVVVGALARQLADPHALEYLGLLRHQHAGRARETRVEELVEFILAVPVREPGRESPRDTADAHQEHEQAPVQ